MALFELRQVSRTYHLGDLMVRALKEVSLAIEAGELLAFMGPSGSGKSTLCHLLGLLDNPTSGKLLLDGQDASELDEDGRAELRNRKIGFVFQNFSLVPVLTALENVQLPLLFRPGHESLARKRAAEALEAVGLTPCSRQRPNQLSGGQQQRVAIARALVTHAEVVIADEPTANLDSEAAESLMDLIQKLNAERKTTFLLATHDARLLRSIPRQISLHDGEVVSDQKGARS